MSLRFVYICVCGLSLIAAAPAQPQTEGHDPELLALKKARDTADVATLQKAVGEARQEAQQKNTADAYQRVALLDSWLCEAGHAKNDGNLVKKAAEDGVEAAKKAAILDPKSSEAHRLEGELLGTMIPYVFAGGMRNGPESTSEIEKAISLDPNNVNAYIARATNYFFTPSAFGGSNEKAVEMLKKAISLDPKSDTAHIWLAQVYLQEKQNTDALKEINEALRLDPERSFAQHVYQQVTARATKTKG